MADASTEEELLLEVDTFDYLPQPPSAAILGDSGKKKTSKGLRMRCHNSGHDWGRNEDGTKGAVCKTCGKKHRKRFQKLWMNQDRDDDLFSLR